MGRQTLGAVAGLALLLAAAPAFAAKGDNVIRFGIQYMDLRQDLVSPEESDLSLVDDLYGDLAVNYDPTSDPSVIFIPTNDAGEPIAAVTFDPDGALTMEIGYERFLLDWMGLTASLSRAKPDVNISAVAGEPGDPDIPGDEGEPVVDPVYGKVILNGSWSGEISMTPVTFGVNFHYVTDGGFDLYGGPMVAYVLYSDLQYGDLSLVVTSAEPATVGIEIDEASDTFDNTSGKYDVDADFGYGAFLGIDLPVGQGGSALTLQTKYLSTKASFEESGAQKELDMSSFIIQLGWRWKF